jgi:hypothetical protein
VLSFDGEGCGLVFGDLLALPKTFQQIEAKVPAKRALDHLAVTLARPRGANLHGPEDCIVDGERGSDL